MNILFVDDQKEVLRRLKDGIHWEHLPVEKIYTACSAQDARLILNNFQVDVLFSDIEMPEEDGLSLCTWARQKFPELEVVFLTSHADFDYARKAFEIGSFHYILQPVREAEVEDVIRRLDERLAQREDYRRIKMRQMKVLGQKNTLLDAMLQAMEQGETEKAEESFACIRDILSLEFENCTVFPVLLQIVSWRRITETWPDKQIRMTVCNVLDELLEERKGKAGIAGLEENQYWVFIALEGREDVPDFLLKTLELFWNFLEQNTDFHTALYPFLENGGFAGAYAALTQRMRANHERRRGVFPDDPADAGNNASQAGVDSGKSAVEQAVAYIRKNIRKNISRTEMADYVHLNEEYFSRLFKKETGVGFKEFVQVEKMEEAKKYLSQSVLSVEVIASKLGYHNLSHFSTAFKKVTDCTPQEYRNRARQ